MRYTLPALALASVLCLPLSSPFASAQQTDDNTAAATDSMHNMHRMRGPMTTEDQLAHMSKALELSTEQQAQIKPLLDARRQQMMTIHSDQSLSHEDRMTKMKSLDDDTHSKIAALLNDKQKAKFEQMAQRREQNMERHGAGAPGGDNANPQPQQ